MSNTPLNDALTNVIVWLEGGCDPKHAAAELRLIRESANTPESSAAQGAMGDDYEKRASARVQSQIRHLMECCKTDANGWLSHRTELARDKLLTFIHQDHCHVAQPSDATAQPMYQIRDLGNTPDGYVNAWFDASEDAYHLTPENKRRILYVALANTAQGKTDHIGDVNEMVGDDVLAAKKS